MRPLRPADAKSAAFPPRFPPVVPSFETGLRDAILRIAPQPLLRMKGWESGQILQLHPEEAIEEARQRRLEMAVSEDETPVSKDVPGVGLRSCPAGMLENFLS